MASAQPGWPTRHRGPFGIEREVAQQADARVGAVDDLVVHDEPEPHPLADRHDGEVVARRAVPNHCSARVSDRTSLSTTPGGPAPPRSSGPAVPPSSPGSARRRRGRLRRRRARRGSPRPRGCRRTRRRATVRAARAPGRPPWPPPLRGALRVAGLRAEDRCPQRRQHGVRGVGVSLTPTKWWDRSSTSSGRVGRPEPRRSRARLDEQPEPATAWTGG